MSKSDKKRRDVQMAAANDSSIEPPATTADGQRRFA